jgi:hypothetical protein
MSFRLSQTETCIHLIRLANGFIHRLQADQSLPFGVWPIVHTSCAHSASIHGAARQLRPEGPARHASVHRACRTARGGDRGNPNAASHDAAQCAGWNIRRRKPRTVT